MRIEEWAEKKKKLENYFQESDISFKKNYLLNKKYSSYISYSYEDSIYMITIYFKCINSIENLVEISLKKKTNIMGEFFQIEEIESKIYTIEEYEKIAKYFKKLKTKIKLLEVFIQ
jgi:hypothetical protein